MEREIAWLRGGFNAVHRDHPELVDYNPPADEGEDDEAAGEHETDGDPSPLGPGKMAPVPTSTRVLRAKHLPQSAFTSASTIPIRPRVRPSSSCFSSCSPCP